ncbi:hypothetical protein ACBI99_42180 [Nonomuraea sp. ATR24]|uniref:hypothetical protein n=1 Tax=Nonomuraea TaxID=83681 RepID=UPI001C5FB7AF|nr:hypothetical protein [Nonomuraea ceibae]
MDPIEDLDRRLRETREAVRRFDQLAARRSTVNTQLREVTEAVTRLEAELKKEQRDVTRLEGGFSGFLAGLTGGKQERLTRERAEAQAAAERLDGQRHRLTDLTADLEATDRVLSHLAGAAEAYEQALADKESLLVNLADPRAQRLIDLATQLADTEADLREHDEAIQAGDTARRAVAEMLALLKHAHGASTFDMLGGGAFADAVEHHHLRAADQVAWHAQRALDVFSRELADIGWTATPRLPKVDTRWFADTFFDNIITDALKHQRINRTRNAVTAMSQWLGTSLHTLTVQRNDLAALHTQLLQEREHLLTA